MKDKTIYKIEIDGEIQAEEFESIQKAQNAIYTTFEGNQELKQADILRFKYENVGITILNKNQ